MLPRLAADGRAGRQAYPSRAYDQNFVLPCVSPHTYFPSIRKHFLSLCVHADVWIRSYLERLSNTYFFRDRLAPAATAVTTSWTEQHAFTPLDWRANKKPTISIRWPILHSQLRLWTFSHFSFSVSRCCCGLQLRDTENCVKTRLLMKQILPSHVNIIEI